MRAIYAAIICLICGLWPLSVSAQDHPVTDFFLDGIQSKINDVLDRATADGNTLIANLAQRALDVIKAWEKSNQALLKTAFDRLDNTTQMFFNKMDNTFSRLESDETITMHDAELLSANWAGFVKEILPWARNPEVYLYYPRVIVPATSDGIVPVHVIGPSLSSSNPSLTWKNDNIKLDRAQESELIAEIDRSTLTFADASSNLISYKLRFDSVGFVWYNPTTWFNSDKTSRDLTIWLLPKFSAKYDIKQTIQQSRTQKESFPKTLSPHGKDSPYDETVVVPPDLAQAGWKIDFDQILQTHFWGNPAQSGGSSCTGPVRESLQEDRFTFRMQLGHETGDFGHKSDGSVVCTLTVPVTRDVKNNVPGPELTGDINWKDDKPVPLDQSIVSYELTLTMFNGRSYSMMDKTKDPYEVVEIMKEPGRLTFRPHPPNNF